VSVILPHSSPTIFAHSPDPPLSPQPAPRLWRASGSPCVFLATSITEMDSGKFEAMETAEMSEEIFGRCANVTDTSTSAAYSDHRQSCRPLA
jgi:hypothetical protein